MSSNPLARAHRRRAVRRLAGIGAILLSGACHGLLDVSNPTIVQDNDIADASGANSRRLSVSAQLNTSFTAIAQDVALFTDEWHLDRVAFGSGPAVSMQATLDQRDSQGYEALYTRDVGGSTGDPHLGYLDAIVAFADVAIPAIHAYTPDSLEGDFLAQLFTIKAFAVLQMAEDICPGFPINEVSNALPVFNPPYSTDSAIGYAISLLDSADASVHDSTRFRDFARILRGRALEDLGQYTAAAAAVADVSTDFVYTTENHPGAYVPKTAYCKFANCQNYVMADVEGGNGLPFISANDPRMFATRLGPSVRSAADTDYWSGKYPTNTTPAAIASGVEARLIEAEAALNAGDPSWFATLNTLRATMFSPAIAAIPTIPTTMDAQVDLLYQERAFWLYLTGRRLGDVRRLIRHYSRDPETVFPTGNYPLGGVYKGATAIPFVLATEAAQNPHLTSGCTTR